MLQSRGLKHGGGRRRHTRRKIRTRQNHGFPREKAIYTMGCVVRRGRIKLTTLAISLCARVACGDVDRAHDQSVDIPDVAFWIGGTGVWSNGSNWNTGNIAGTSALLNIFIDGGNPVNSW